MFISENIDGCSNSVSNNRVDKSSLSINSISSTESLNESQNISPNNFQQKTVYVGKKTSKKFPRAIKTEVCIEILEDKAKSECLSISNSDSELGSVSKSIYNEKSKDIKTNELDTNLDSRFQSTEKNVSKSQSKSESTEKKFLSLESKKLNNSASFADLNDIIYIGNTSDEDDLGIDEFYKNSDGDISEGGDLKPVKKLKSDSVMDPGKKQKKLLLDRAKKKLRNFFVTLPCEDEDIQLIDLELDSDIDIKMEDHYKLAKDNQEDSNSSIRKKSEANSQNDFEEESFFFCSFCLADTSKNCNCDEELSFSKYFDNLLNKIPKSINNLKYESDRNSVICSNCGKSGHFNCMIFDENYQKKLLLNDEVYNFDCDYHAELQKKYLTKNNMAKKSTTPKKDYNSYKHNQQSNYYPNYNQYNVYNQYNNYDEADYYGYYPTYGKYPSQSNYNNYYWYGQGYSYPYWIKNKFRQK